MCIKPQKIADLKTVVSKTPTNSDRVGVNNSKLQTKEILVFAKKLRKTHGANYRIKQYTADIVAEFGISVCDRAVDDFLVRMKIRIRKPQRNPAKSRSLQSKNRKGE